MQVVSGNGANFGSQTYFGFITFAQPKLEKKPTLFLPHTLDLAMGITLKWFFVLGLSSGSLEIPIL
jgi:hypothetical protein